MPAKLFAMGVLLVLPGFGAGAGAGGGDNDRPAVQRETAAAWRRDPGRRDGAPGRRGPRAAPPLMTPQRDPVASPRRTAGRSMGGPDRHAGPGGRPASIRLPKQPVPSKRSMRRGRRCRRNPRCRL